MSYSFDNMDGWDLFNMPFSKPVKTAPARQQAARSQQKPSESMQRNVTSEPARRNPAPAQTQKTPQLSHHAPGTQPKQPAVKQSEPVQAAPVAPTSDKEITPKAVTPAPAQAVPTKQAPADSPKAPANTTPAPPQKELVLDMSSGSDAAQDDADRRKAHEEAEAKRKAEWESKQAAKKQAEEEALQKLNAMSDADIAVAAVKRVSRDTEHFASRNMREAVAEYIQLACKESPSFAKKVMHPKKNMTRCFSYIYRMARDFLRIENNGIKLENGIGGDVPDAICLQWAYDYFDNPVAEDEATEEKFIPKPYVPAPSKSAKKKEKKPKKQQKTQSDGYEQMSLEGVIG